MLIKTTVKELKQLQKQHGVVFYNADSIRSTTLFVGDGSRKHYNVLRQYANLKRVDGVLDQDVFNYNYLVASACLWVTTGEFIRTALGFPALTVV